MLHKGFANATKVSLCDSDQQNFEDMKKQTASTIAL